MKKHLLSFLFAALTCISNVSSQQLKTLLGETVEYTKKHNFVFAGYDDTNFYLLVFDDKNGKHVAGITAYSRATVKEVFSKPIVMPEYVGDEFTVHEILISQDKILLFYSYYSKENKQLRLMASPYSKDGNLSGKEVEIMSASAKSKSGSGSFAVVLSDNKKYFFVLHYQPEMEIPYYEIKEYFINIEKKYRFKIMNADLETLYEKEAVLDGGRGSGHFKKTYVASNGNIYIFASSRDAGYFIKTINLKNKTENEITLKRKYDIKEFSISHSKVANFSVDNKGGVYFLGLYGTNNNLQTNGIYIAKFSEDGTVKSDTIIPYSVSDDIKSKSKPGKEIIKDSYNIKDVKFRDENISILYSKKSSVFGGYPDRAGSPDRGEGMFNTILGYDSKISSETFVYKMQVPGINQDEFAYEIPFSSGTRSYFLYNDTKENMERENSEIDATAVFEGKTFAQYVNFDSTGGFTKALLFTDTQSPGKRLLIPERCLRMDNNEIVVLTKLAEDYKLCKIFSENK